MKEQYRTVYRQINESFTGHPLVFRVGIDAGFFTELRYMAAAMLWCLEHRVRFELYSDGANFGTWGEFFEPFCPERHEAWHKTLNRRAMPSMAQMREREGRIHVSTFNLLKWKAKTRLCAVAGHLRGRCLLSQDVPADPQKHYRIPELDIDGGWIDGLCRMTEVFWHPHCLVPFPLPEAFAGCQLRGGDKDTEVELVSPTDVVRSLPEDIKDVVVLTDDHRLLEQVRGAFPRRTFHSLCQPSEQGYVHGAFVHRGSEEKHAQMCRFITTMDALFRARCFAGSVGPAPSLVMLAWHHNHGGGGLPTDWPSDSIPEVLLLPVSRRGKV